MTHTITEMADLFDPEVVERLSDLAEGSDDYAEVMNLRVVATVSKLGVIDGETDEVEIRLADARSVNLSYDRVFELLDDDGRLIYAEADHRGPEHGIDGWIGSTKKPEFALESIELKGARS